MSKFIQTTVPPNRVFTEESVNKSGDMAWTKEGMISSDDSCLFEFIDRLVMCELSRCW